MSEDAAAPAPKAPPDVVAPVLEKLAHGEPSPLPKPPRRIFSHLFTLTLFLAGSYLLYALARDIGIQPVRENARALLWFVPAATAIHVAVHLFNTLGWRHAIGPLAGRVGFGRLFLAWAVGDLVNWGTPGAFGGELLRAHLIRDRVPLRVGMSSVTVGRLAQTLAQFSFITFGVFFCWTRLDLTTLERGVLVVVNVGAVIFLGGMYLLQRTRTFGLAMAAARKLGAKGRIVDFVERKIGTLDEEIRSYHAGDDGDFRRSILCFLAGWVLQASEVPLILWAFGASIDVRGVVAIESLAIFVEAIAFLVPGKVGVDEGGRVILFRALGYGSPLGLGFSLFRRSRELVWFGACLLLLPFLSRHVGRNVETFGLAPDDGATPLPPAATEK